MARSVARTAAMQMIYERVSGGEADDDSLRMIYDEFRDESISQVEKDDPGLMDRAFITQLLECVLEHLDEIDAIIERHCKNWALDRLARVDLTILRVAVGEMLYGADRSTPVSVVIDEAVEMAKTFSEPESGRFVNGVLGAIARDEVAKRDA